MSLCSSLMLLAKIVCPENVLVCLARWDLSKWRKYVRLCLKLHGPLKWKPKNSAIANFESKLNFMKTLLELEMSTVILIWNFQQWTCGHGDTSMVVEVLGYLRRDGRHIEWLAFACQISSDFSHQLFFRTQLNCEFANIYDRQQPSNGPECFSLMIQKKQELPNKHFGQNSFKYKIGHTFQILFLQ